MECIEGKKSGVKFYDDMKDKLSKYPAILNLPDDNFKKASGKQEQGHTDSFARLADDIVVFSHLVHTKRIQ